MRQAKGEAVDLPLLNEQRNLEQLGSAGPTWSGKSAWSAT